jgi:hypothetical protein
MSVTANQLSNSCARGKEIDAIVHEQLRIIDDRLLKAERRWGRNVLAYELPTSFPISLEKNDAQRIIYSAVLRSLDKRGFETKISLNAESSVIYIAWLTELDAEEVAAMNALIKSKLLADEEKINTFKQKPSLEIQQGSGKELVVTEKGRKIKPRGGVE